MDSYRFAKTGEIPAVIGRPGTTGSGNRFESELSCRLPNPVTCALEERRSRLFSSPFNGWERLTPLPTNTEERQNRRAKGSSVLPPISGTAFQAQPPPLRVGGLRVFVSSCLQRGRGGPICVYLRYLRFLRMNDFVLICVICGQSGRVGGSVSLCLCGYSVFNAPESRPSGL